MTSPEVSRLDVESVGGMIETHVAQMGARRVLVDSITHFQRLTIDPVELRALEYSFINGLKREGLTCLLTRESSALLGESPEGDSSIAFVVDTYVLLRYVEIESAIHKALLVLKMRGSDHAKDIRQFEITDHGVEVQSKFEGREGIMSGSPRRMADSFVEAFVKR
jgi:circadian clock protein KaiC